MNLKQLVALFAVLFSLQIAVFSQNILSNGSFENGVTDWNNLAGDGATVAYSVISTDAVAGSNSMQVSVSALGSNPWSIQSIHTTTPMITGSSYQLSFYAKSSNVGSSLNFVVQNNAYLAQSFALSTTWTRYEWNFTAAEEDPQLRIQYSNVDTYLIDNVQIISETPVGTMSIAVKPTTTHQTMIGFGGAITWYCDLVTKSAKKNEIIDLMINDVGTDIVRFKNWYYPTGYPEVKTTTNMEESYFKGHFDATNELHTLIKQANPQVEVLLSSWSPPAAYKSNGTQNEGTLKKDDNGQFMYNELGAYYKDVLDNISFDPEYFSFQNEPGYVNANWSTCEWRPLETAEYPGYGQGLDAVYNAIKDRSFVPKIIGPESENIGNAVWNSAENSFRDMINPVKDRPYLYGYAYHLYNYANSPNNLSPGLLNMIKNEFSDKPNLMTEFSSSNFDWLQSADAIHQTVVQANAAAYIYWELMWETASTSTMIGMDNSGEYSIRDHYYTLKHYAKHVDKGHKRIEVSGGNSNVKISGYLNVERNQITLVAINNNESEQEIELAFEDASVADILAYQSVAGDFYAELGTVNPTTTLPAKSLTTFVANLSNVIAGSENSHAKKLVKAYPTPFEHTVALETTGDFMFEIYALDGVLQEQGSGNNTVHVGSNLTPRMYVVKVVQNGNTQTFKIAKN